MRNPCWRRVLEEEPVRGSILDPAHPEAVVGAVSSDRPRRLSVLFDSSFRHESGGTIATHAPQVKSDCAYSCGKFAETKRSG